MAISKVIYGGTTLIDLTADTVVKEKLLKGYTAHGADGELVEGTCDFDTNTQDATASESEILFAKTAYVRGSKVIGKMPNHAGMDDTISTKDEEVEIPQGYHDGSGKVGIDAIEKAKLIASNIREGVTVLGVTGTMSGQEDVRAQSKTATARRGVTQTILPDEGYNYLSSVEVQPIPYTAIENSAGGHTVTIG